MAICPHCERTSTDVLDPCPGGDGFFCIDEDEYYAHSDDRLLGREVAGRYIVQEVLGRGSMSRVYKAHQGQVDRSVALKIFRPESILGRTRPGDTTKEEREQAEQRFEREAKVLGQLSHPNCVTVYDFGAGDDRSFLYMAMEHVAGFPLRSAISRGLKFPAIVEIARQVLEALREAHSLDIVHRDLKPENIILSFRMSSDERVVKVLDFGIAKLLRADISDHGENRLFGTPAYMSPEQCRGDVEAVSPRSDIYSFGCVLFEMICGRLPFPSDSAQKMLRLHQTAEIPELVARSNVEVNDEIRSFVRTCLQKDPPDRFSSASEALAALDAAVAGGGLEEQSAPSVPAGGDSARLHSPEVGSGDASREVEVPENAVSGKQLDPIGRDEVGGEEETGESDRAAEAGGSAAGSSALAEPFVDEGGTAPDQGRGALSTWEEAEPEPVEPGEASARSAEPTSTGTQTVSGGTAAGEDGALSMGGRVRELFERRTVLVMAALATVLVACIVLFYLIYSSIMAA
ncbi:MAG: serine/threonine protein kinase [Bradymonadaceae bacterium]